MNMAEHLHGCDDGGGCIMHREISDLQTRVGFLDRSVNGGNGEDGILRDLKGHITQFAGHREEFKEFLGTYRGVVEAEKEAALEKERSEIKWRWIVGGLCACILAIAMWLLSILLPAPLKERGLISHENKTLVQQHDQISADHSIPKE